MVTSVLSIPVLLKIYKSLADSKWDLPYILLLLLLEAILSSAIVKYVSYTEIDWEAYMQEVTIWQDGELDYANIYGGTGPLVYPAGFLYMYAFFKWLTGGGTNVLIGQKLFCGLYVLNAAFVLAIYNIIARNLVDTLREKESSNQSLKSSHGVWSWRVAMGVTCLSKRIHSIFVLRLFNDGPCMLLFYLSCLLFAKAYWRIGCAFFSAAVSVKMNVLLFAPGLLLLLLQSSDNIVETIICLSICAGIQIIVGAPFLLSYPVSYIRKAFEFDRVFFYEWTVNWKVSCSLLQCYMICLQSDELSNHYSMYSSYRKTCLWQDRCRCFFYSCT
jgi:alpha-1,3-mannosyltransferase